MRTQKAPPHLHDARASPHLGARSTRLPEELLTSAASQHQLGAKHLKRRAMCDVGGDDDESARSRK